MHWPVGPLKYGGSHAHYKTFLITSEISLINYCRCKSKTKLESICATSNYISCWSRASEWRVWGPWPFCAIFFLILGIYRPTTCRHWQPRDALRHSKLNCCKHRWTFNVVSNECDDIHSLCATTHPFWQNSIRPMTHRHWNIRRAKIVSRW